MRVELMILGFDHRSALYMKSLFVRLINSSNYQREPARLRVSTSDNPWSLGPQDEDVGRSMDKNGRRYTATWLGDLFASLSRRHRVDTRWARRKIKRETEKDRRREYMVRKAGVFAGWTSSVSNINSVPTSVSTSSSSSSSSLAVLRLFFYVYFLVTWPDWSNLCA